MPSARIPQSADEVWAEMRHYLGPDAADGATAQVAERVWRWIEAARAEWQTGRPVSELCSGEASEYVLVRGTQGGMFVVVPREAAIRSMPKVAVWWPLPGQPPPETTLADEARGWLRRGTSRQLEAFLRRVIDETGG